MSSQLTDVGVVLVPPPARVEPNLLARNVPALQAGAGTSLTLAGEEKKISNPITIY